MSKRELEFKMPLPFWVWAWKAYDKAVFDEGFEGSIGEWITELIVQVLRSESK